MNEALDRLGSLAGIVESYLDIYGQEHRPSQDTKRRILTAMGFPCQTPAEVSGSLLELANRPWRCVVDPVTILAEGAAPSLPMHIPERLEKAAWRWDLQREDGRTDSGEFRPFALPQEGSRTLEGQAVSRRRLLLPSGVEAGYHTLRLSQGNAYAESLLICAPERAWLPSWFLRGERRWGVACQAFGLRRQRDWGSGDYAALGALAAQGGAWGADALGISPLHALFAEKPEEASPYYPSSRLFLNPLYLAPESIAGFAECAPALATLKAPATQALLAQSRGSTLVDYTAAWKLKLPVLRLLFDCFQKQHPPGVNSDALRRD
ncbi:MAG: 4-alpha-glucanotransferase, partial [Deltaproteobacteria bacterium]|nr:4-alpha-glucanotransferase [Deltaproteobacteria bacterium]